MEKNQKTFRILVVGSTKWSALGVLDAALSRHVVHHVVGGLRTVTVACGDRDGGVDSLCRDLVTRMQPKFTAQSLKLEIREAASLEYPVGFDVVLAFPLEPSDWELPHRANLLGVEVQVFPEKNR